MTFKQIGIPDDIEAGRPKAQKYSKRLAIVETVIDILATEGVHCLSAEEVAKRNKIRRSNVIYYFPKREDLIVAAIEHVVSVGQDITIAALAKASSPTECLVAHHRANWSWFAKYPKHAPVFALLQAYSIVTRGYSYRALNTKIRKVGEERIMHFLGAGRKIPRRQLRLAARQIREVLVGTLTMYFSTETYESFNSARKRSEREVLKIAESLWK